MMVALSAKHHAAKAFRINARLGTCTTNGIQVTQLILCIFLREMHHEAGVSHLDLRPMMMVLGAVIASMRYIGMSAGDKALYIMDSIGAALFLTFRFFIFKKGTGR